MIREADSVPDALCYLGCWLAAWFRGELGCPHSAHEAEAVAWADYEIEVWS